MARMKTTGPHATSKSKGTKIKASTATTAKKKVPEKRKTIAKFTTTKAAVLMTETSIYGDSGCEPDREVFDSQELANAYVLKSWKEFNESSTEELKLFKNKAGYYKVDMAGDDGTSETYEAQPWSPDLKWERVKPSGSRTQSGDDSDDKSDAESDPFSDLD